MGWNVLTAANALWFFEAVYSFFGCAKAAIIESKRRQEAAAACEAGRQAHQVADV